MVAGAGEPRRGVVLRIDGNAGVAGEVRTNKGTIGYISAYYLVNQKISTAAVENQAGNFELPGPSNILEAAKSNSKITPQGPNFTGLSIVNPPKKYKTAFPISTYTYAMVNTNDSNMSAVKDFLNWVISPSGGLYTGSPLDFPQLPANVRAIDSNLVNSL